MPSAIQAEGVMSWEYQTLIPALVSVGRGMLATWWVPSAR